MSNSNFRPAPAKVTDNLTSTHTNEALSANQGRIIQNSILAYITSITANPIQVSRIRVRLSGNTVNNVAHLRELRFMDDTGTKVQYADVTLTSGAGSAVPISAFLADLPFDDDPNTWWGMTNTTPMTNPTDISEAIYTLHTPRKIVSFTMSVVLFARTYYSGSLEAQFVGHNPGTLADGSDGTWYPIIAPQQFAQVDTNNTTQGTMTGYQPVFRT